MSIESSTHFLSDEWNESGSSSSCVKLFLGPNTSENFKQLMILNKINLPEETVGGRLYAVLEVCLAFSIWRGARAVEWDGLENR